MSFAEASSAEESPLVCVVREALPESIASEPTTKHAERTQKTLLIASSLWRVTRVGSPTRGGDRALDHLPSREPASAKFVTSLLCPEPIGSRTTRSDPRGPPPAVEVRLSPGSPSRGASRRGTRGVAR